MTISFLGHSSLPHNIFLLDKIKSTIIENISYKDNVIFLCGGYGDFDNLSAKICRSIKKAYDCEIVLVTPYITLSQQEKLKYIAASDTYDSIMYPPLENIPPRLAIIKRNEWMIDQSDIIIAYVKHKYGGAYRGLEYARRKKKQIINLAEQ
ncbi:MAG: hypothetical protein E7626_02235 [Ruminococcaceae bacterium]|nr:hypothetical protein [Oscillospiraceae bacterium]